MIILVPMAGPTDAFGSDFPYGKGLAEIAGRPLVQHVIDNLTPLGGRFVVVIRRDDARRHHLESVIRLLVPGATVVVAQAATAGAACTALLAVEHLTAGEELVIANGDQLIRADLPAAIADFRKRELDGGTVVFDSVHPRWSYVRLGPDGLVREAAEKRPISRHATAGFYYFRRAADFVSAAGNMIRKNDHSGGNFFVCPTFNQMILAGQRVGVSEISRGAYISLATPHDLSEYEERLTAEGRA
jgi:dTDP-glucose pyrophosphorylase